MFLSYIPDESTGHYYAGILPLSETPGCCSKIDAERLGRTCTIIICKVSACLCLHHNRISVLIVLHLCLISRPNVCMCLGYPVKI